MPRGNITPVLLRAGTQVIGSPTALAGVPTASQVTLAWAASPDAETYHLYRDGVHLIDIAAPTVTHIDLGLTTATTYAYRISVTDTEGRTSNVSAPVDVTTL